MLTKFARFLFILLSSGTFNAVMAAKHDVEFKKFPVVAYSVDPANDKNFKLASELGFNMVHSYKIGRDDKANIKRGLEFLELAGKHGLKVMLNLRGKSWAGKNYDLEKFTKFIRRFKDHPALGMWYLYDEPRIDALPNLRKLYGVLKQETPNIPVAIAMCWSIDWDKFSGTYDVIMPDIYPVGDQSFPNAPLQQFTDFTERAVGLGEPVIPVAQMLNWRVFPKEAKGREFDLKKCRYPNAAELRYWMFASAVIGSKGLAYYSYYWTITHDGALSWAKDTFRPSLQEFKQFVKLTDSFKQRQVLSRSRDARMLSMLCKNGGKEYLVLINNWPTERKNVKRWLENKVENAELAPWGETRKTGAFVKGGKLDLNSVMKPWEVFVWEVKRNKGGVK
jgi:hypothetical protein